MPYLWHQQRKQSISKANSLSKNQSTSSELVWMISFHHFGNALRRRGNAGYEVLTDTEPNTSGAGTKGESHSSEKPAMSSDTTIASPKAQAPAQTIAPPVVRSTTSRSPVFFERLRGKELAFTTLYPNVKMGTRIFRPRLDELLTDVAFCREKGNAKDEYAHGSSRGVGISLFRAPNKGVAMYTYELHVVGNLNFPEIPKSDPYKRFYDNSYKETKQLVNMMTNHLKENITAWDDQKKIHITPTFTEITIYNKDLVASEKVIAERVMEQYRVSQEIDKRRDAQRTIIHAAHMKKLAEERDLSQLETLPDAESG